MITVEVLGHEIEVGWVDGVAVSHNGVSFSGTHRIDFIDSNSVTFHVERVGKKITVSATSSGGGGGGGLNATVSGGVELVNDNITLGSVLIRDVLIPGNNFGAQWGADDSPIGFFRWIGNNWSILWSNATLYFKSAAGFGFDGEGSTSPAWFNNLAGLVIGGNTMNGSAIFQLISNTKALLFNIVNPLTGIAAPAQGMMVGSTEKDDILLYWNNVWTGITRPEIFVTDEQNFLLEEKHRNAIVVMRYNGNATATPAIGLSKGWTTFVYKKNGTAGYLELTEAPYQEIDAFNSRIYVGGAAIINQGSEVFLVSGSLGQLINQSTIQDAIDQAEADAIATSNAYADLVHFGTDISGSLTLALTHAGKWMDVTAAATITVPPNSSVAFPLGTQMIFRQYAAGQVTFAEGVYVDIQSSGNKLKTSGQYAVCTLIKTDTNEWALSGDLSV